ncbi:MAG: EAL domain-containing protein [Arenicellales bacterium]
MSDDSYQLEKRAGEIIFREGDLADFAYIIENGRVEISVERDGRSVALAELGSGEILGEMAVIDRFNRTATATVTRDCRLTVVTPPQILQRVEEADPVVRSLIQILMKRYRAELTRAQGMPMEAASAFVSQSRGIQKIRLENELMRAIANEDVKVVYQPIRDLANGCTSGFEALVRWDHPTRGTIPPEELVSLAEETELIVPLGLHVFEVAAKDRSALAAVGSSELFVSVNVSPRHTLDGDFLGRAKDICDKLGERPANIMLELTESVQADIQSLGAWVAAARAIGFQITVDDFGTGYASLEYLTRLAPDTVKIDRTFVRPIVEDSRTVAVLRRVLQMARDLGVRVIAEGVESSEHVRLLTELGCDMAQGYAIGRPVTCHRAIGQTAGR